MKKSITPCACLLAGLLLGLSGCRKAIEDYLKENPTAEYGYCRLKQFNFRTSGTIGTQRGISDTMVFTYNAYGDPVTGLRAHWSTGYPNFLFRYDHFNRLTDLVGFYGYNPDFSGGVEIWSRYKYDGHGRIVLDSFYMFPTVVDDHPTLGEYGTVFLNTYEYDAQGRIVKFTYGSNYFHTPTVYSYGADGNLTGTPHDNKINLHRTNKVWMFLDRDYSVNNPLTAAYTYNDHGLPVGIIPTAGTEMSFMDLGWTQLEYDRADVRYDCK